MDIFIYCPCFWRTIISWLSQPVVMQFKAYFFELILQDVALVQSTVGWNFQLRYRTGANPALWGIWMIVRINLPLFSTIVTSSIFMFLSCRPFVVITTLSTGLVGVEVTSFSWLGQLTVLVFGWYWSLAVIPV